MPSASSSSTPSESDDGFDRIPDHVVLLIFNRVSDLKTLAGCRSVSKRFRSLVPHSDTLLLRVDSVISTQSKGFFLLHLLRSIFSSFHRLVSPKPPNRHRRSPSDILRCYHSVRDLEIELPSGDLKLEKGTILKWTAKFGKSLRYCVILGARGVSDAAAGVDDDQEFDDADVYGDRGGLKLRVVWTISALIAASVRHYLARDVIRERNELERLVLRDRDGEGAVAMDERGLKELKDAQEEAEADDRKKRTTVPAVRMRMRHAASIELAGGGRMRGATLVVVWAEGEKEEEGGEMEEFVKGAFGGVTGEAVDALLKRRSCVLEMNSF
ncbi:hypothetical protein ACLOJK_013278 [Asimina triloba]